MNRKLSIPALLVAAVPLVGCAPPTTTEVAAPTATFTDSGLQAIRDEIQGAIEAGEIAGAVAVIAHGDEQVMFESFGRRSLESGAPMTDDTIFRVYSMTKPITSTAVMMLNEQGHFDLDDPVGVYLPELADLEVGVENTEEEGEPTLTREPAARPVTIRDLLRHTSGMTYGVFAQSMVDSLYLQSGAMNAEDLAAMVSVIGTLPLKHQPGTGFEYSVSTDVLARLVEVVSGQRFDEFLHQHILGPLQMNDTAFWVPEDKLDRLAGYYQQTEGGLVPMDEGDRFVTPPTLLSGGGGLVSTAADYLRFCRMILAGGELEGVRILRRETVELMGTDQLAGLPGIEGSPGGSMVAGFGLGFALTPDAGPDETSPGSLYWYGYASTAFWIDPSEELIGIYLVQVQPFDTGHGDRFRSLAYEALTLAEATTEP